MSAFEWSGMAVGIAGLAFLFLPPIGRWLRRNHGQRGLRPAEEVLSVLLGIVMLCFWLIWWSIRGAS